MQGNTGAGVRADSAYRSEAIEAKLHDRKLKSHIHRKGKRGKPLTDQAKGSNRTRSSVRVRVEHVFGAQTNDMGGTLVRTIGIARARAKIGMKNIAYNMRRLVQLRGASTRARRDHRVDDQADPPRWQEKLRLKSTESRNPEGTRPSDDPHHTALCNLWCRLTAKTVENRDAHDSRRSVPRTGLIRLTQPTHAPGARRLSSLPPRRSQPFGSASRLRRWVSIASAKSRYSAESSGV